MAKFLFWGSVSVEQRAADEIKQHEQALYDAETQLSKAEIAVEAHRKEITRLRLKAVAFNSITTRGEAVATAVDEPEPPRVHLKNRITTV